MVEAETVTNEALIELDVDILIPAALENVITGENAARVLAPVVVEIANGPTTSEADSILHGKGTLVVPDILANAGGVTVSYFEWVQNRQGFRWTLEDVHSRLGEIVSREFSAIHDLMEAKGIDMRTAAYAHALGRIGEAIESQGTSKYFANERGSD
jgi:glutamate dehydrogenase (NADP+)